MRRCAYDPFAGRQCWNQRVSHSHDPPPDLAPYLPRDTTTTTTTTTAPKGCPPGQHSNGGAGRNCHSHSFTPPCGSGTWSPGHGHSSVQRPPCPTTPPPPTTAAPPKCKAGAHRYGNGCHSHGFTPPCGTGTWAPHAGHTPVQRPPCPTTPDDDSGTGPSGAKRCPGRAPTNHMHDGLGCHSASREHCGDGDHAHGGLACHGEDAEHSDDHDSGVTRCYARGGPHHRHDGLSCHSTIANHNHCHDGEHAHNGGSCHPIGVDQCPLGEHEHLTDRTSGCHPTGRQHYKTTEPSYLANITKAVLADLLCGVAAVGGAAVGSAAGPVGATVGAGAAGTGCVALIATFETANDKQKLRMLEEARHRHDKLVKAKNRQDRPPPKPDRTDKQNQNQGEGSDGADSGTSRPTPTTAPPEPDPIPENPTTEQYVEEYRRYQQAVLDYGRGKLSTAERLAATQRYKQVRCNRGRPGDERYC